jgi:signal transduction histidine kinase
MVGIMHDVTQRHQAAEHANVALDRAENARERAERASEAKSEFMSRMSHELRTPLNAILGFAQLLELAPLDGEDADNLIQITRAGRHLLTLVNDALDVARIEAGQLGLALGPVEVWPALAESLDLVRPAAAARSLVVEQPRADAPGHRVRADRNRLRQVLANLLSNAVKYNVPGGGIQVDCRPLLSTGTDADGVPQIRLAVSDTGVGIPAERMDEVFLPFQRLGAETSGVEGTGLGLAVTKSLVEAMGGTISVGSVEGVGTTFYVDLPAA